MTHHNTPTTPEAELADAVIRIRELEARVAVLVAALIRAGAVVCGYERPTEQHNKWIRAALSATDAQAGAAWAALLVEHERLMQNRNESPYITPHTGYAAIDAEAALREAGLR